MAKKCKKEEKDGGKIVKKKRIEGKEESPKQMENYVMEKGGKK